MTFIIIIPNNGTTFKTNMHLHQLCYTRINIINYNFRLYIIIRIFNLEKGKPEMTLHGNKSNLTFLNIFL